MATHSPTHSLKVVVVGGANLVERVKKASKRTTNDERRTTNDERTTNDKGTTKERQKNDERRTKRRRTTNDECERWNDDGKTTTMDGDSVRQLATTTATVTTTKEADGREGSDEWAEAKGRCAFGLVRWFVRRFARLAVCKIADAICPAATSVSLPGPHDGGRNAPGRTICRCVTMQHSAGVSSDVRAIFLVTRFRWCCFFPGFVRFTPNTHTFVGGSRAVPVPVLTNSGNT